MFNKMVSNESGMNKKNDQFYVIDTIYGGYIMGDKYYKNAMAPRDFEKDIGCEFFICQPDGVVLRGMISKDGNIQSVAGEVLYKYRTMLESNGSPKGYEILNADGSAIEGRKMFRFMYENKHLVRLVILGENALRR